jgi:N-acetylglucosaminyl-diphospho-decaprenol L-rhamnosyltransferase
MPLKVCPPGQYSQVSQPSLMLFSICIVTHNSAKVICNCVNSIFGASLRSKCKTEILIVDNNSTDSTLEVIRQQLHNSGIPYQIHSLPANLGWGAANNIAAKQIHPESTLLVFLNPDVILPSSFFEVLTSYIPQAPSHSAGFVPYVYDSLSQQKPSINANPIWTLPDAFFDIFGSRRLKLHLLKSRSHSIQNPYALCKAYPSGSCLIVKADVFRRSGGFDERFFMYCDDAAFCERALRLGYKFTVVPSAIITHSCSTGSEIISRDSINNYGSRIPHKYYFSQESLLNYYELHWGINFAKLLAIYRMTVACGVLRVLRSLGFETAHDAAMLSAVARDYLKKKRAG